MDSNRPIDFGKQLFAGTLGKHLTVIAVVVSCTLGYTKVATTNYVNETAAGVDARIAALALAQTATVEQVETLALAQVNTDKRMVLVVRLVSAQYVEHVDAEENRSKPPMSRKAKRVAAALQIDPDDPLAGLELLQDE